MDLARNRPCPDCESVDPVLDRREFLHSVATTAVGAAVAGPLVEVPRLSAAPPPQSRSETLVRSLYDSLTDAQKRTICFDWDYRHPQRGLLRTHVCNLWQITRPMVASDFYTRDQQAMILDIFRGMFSTEWQPKLLKQLRDDTGRPFGAQQSIAIFGQPGTDRFEFVFTGRHCTVRCDGNTQSHVALGGPIFHGHAPSGYTERVGHPDNIFWHQAQQANGVYRILDGRQQQRALMPRRPAEGAIGFRGPDGSFPGLPCSEMSRDQKDALQRVLMSLLEPYRQEDRDEIQQCLRAMGGLDRCSLAFYRDGDLGDDGEWDNWRLEGPAFVWYFRGTPHVHIWVHVADDPKVPLNAFVDGPAANER